MVAIVTDTTACVPSEQAERYDIEIVPVQLNFENRTYRDGIDIDPVRFYSLLRQAKKLPTTSSSSPEPYLEAFLRVSKKAPDILCITEPSRFSAMFNSARVARDMALKTLGNTRIEVLECSTAAAGLGLVTLAAARSADRGEDLRTVSETAGSVMSRVKLYATLDTLQYLVKSGRVPQAAAMVNSLLNIKPVFTLNHADPHTVALPRTMDSAISRIMKLIEEHTTPDRPLHAAVMHADSPDRAMTLKGRISSRYRCDELFVTEFTPVMGVHTGPGLVGVAFYTD